MAVSYRAFQIELYEEYLADGEFVSGQRESLLANPLGKWGLVRDWEDRIEAYIDGLSVGGDLALEVCRRRALEGEPGEFQIAVRVMCRAGRFSEVEQLAAEAPTLDGLAGALLHERQPGVSGLIQRLVATDAKLLPMLAKVVGHQRIPLAPLLLNGDHNDPSIVWALGRLRERGAIPLMRRAMGETEAGSQDAALALARTQNALDTSGEWPLFAQGLMGEAAQFKALLASEDSDSSLALGLMGLPNAVPELIARLPQPLAALALQLITGAGLIAEQPIAGEELEEGERPTMETLLVTDPAAWRQWWNDHQSQFRSSTAYRCGQPYTVPALKEVLANPDAMHIERYWAAEQLASRHGAVLGFETNMLVTEQPAALQS